MIKLARNIVLVLAGLLFVISLLFSPDQEIQIRFWPGQELISFSLAAVAFGYCGFGLVVAMILGLLDRAGLMLQLKKMQKEGKALESQTIELKSILADETVQLDSGKDTE